MEVKTQQSNPPSLELKEVTAYLGASPTPDFRSNQDRVVREEERPLLKPWEISALIAE